MINNKIAVYLLAYSLTCALMTRAAAGVRASLDPPCGHEGQQQLQRPL